MTRHTRGCVKKKGQKGLNKKVESSKGEVGRKRKREGGGIVAKRVEHGGAEGEREEVEGRKWRM